jgi:feruloyl esterase
LAWFGSPKLSPAGNRKLRRAAEGALQRGPKNPRTGKQILPGYPMGTEAIPGGWSPWILPPGLQAMFGNSYYGQVVFEQAN